MYTCIIQYTVQLWNNWTVLKLLLDNACWPLLHTHSTFHLKEHTTCIYSPFIFTKASFINACGWILHKLECRWATASNLAAEWRRILAGVLPSLVAMSIDWVAWQTVAVFIFVTSGGVAVAYWKAYRWTGAWSNPGGWLEGTNNWKLISYLKLGLYCHILQIVKCFTVHISYKDCPLLSHCPEFHTGASCKVRLDQFFFQTCHLNCCWFLSV